MNYSLVNIAENLPNLRNILNLKQSDLSNLMEISRPTLIKIEQNPTKFNYPLAINLFGSIMYFLKSDQNIVSVVKEDKEKSLELFMSLLSNNCALKSFSNSNINCILVDLFPELKNNSFAREDQCYLNIIDSDPADFHEKFVFLLEQYISKKSLDCLKIFNISDWDIVEFVLKIK